MCITSKKLAEYLIVDTTAFIQNAALQNIAEVIVTCPEVVDEVTNKRQLRRLVVLPYDLVVKEVFPENVKIITDFAKKTGDYPSLSATDIKVMALTYQLEKEKVGIDHLRQEPIREKCVVANKNAVPHMTPDLTGFFLPKNLSADMKDGESLTNSDSNKTEDATDIDDATRKFTLLQCAGKENMEDIKADDVLITAQEGDSDEYETNDSDDEDGGWITPGNVEIAKRHVNSELVEEKHVTIACMTTDFAMQNVLRQINLNVCALDGRIIKQLRSYILRCYTCFKTTSIMTKKFCPKCGNSTLKRVAVSVDENGKMQIYINPKRPLSGKGKRFSLPRIKGGKHPNNPILVEDQPMPQNRPSRLARTKTNPLDDDYIAGYSPFVMRDVNSKSAQLCIRPGQELKHLIRKNPNEARRRKK